MIGFVNKFQQGGAAPQGGQDMQQQIVALVQAAMQGDQKATETINQIMQAAQQGDQQAAQLAQMIQQVTQQMQGQAQMRKQGGYLAHLHKLNTGCPEGEEPHYYKVGGRVCKKCMKKMEQGAEVQEKKCGGKAKKMENGGKDRVYFDKCGKKIKK